MVTVKHTRTMLAHVRSDTQTLRCAFPTRAALLTCIACINPANFTTSTFNLVLKNVQELCPPRVQNTFTQSSVTCHTGDIQLFHHDDRIQQRVVVGDLEMEIPSLTVNLQMRLRNAPCRLLASVASLVSAAQRALLPPQGRLRCAEEPRIGSRITVAISQERRQSNINPDSRTNILRRNNVTRGGVSQTIKAYQ